MFKNYIKIAWRNLKKQPFFTFLNTFGLAVGMAGALLISLYIYDEFSYDTMFTDADRIHRINADITYGLNENSLATVTPPMAATVKNDYPQVQLATRLRGWGSILVRKANSQKNIKTTGNVYADPNFFELFGLDLIEGDVNTALIQPNTLVLTKSTAKTHFGNEQALGKQLILENQNTYTITGVIENFPENSFLRDYSMLMSMASHADSKSDSWGSNNYSTFIKLLPNSNVADFETQLQDVFINYVVPYAKKTFAPDMTMEKFKEGGNSYEFSLTALKNIRLHSNRTAELNANNNIQNIYILSFIALFLIVLASVNFMNLSTAQSLKRAKEVGIRKTLGSNKLDLVKQFLIESGLITFVSLIIAIIVAAIAMPYFNELAGKELSIPFLSPFFWLTIIISVLLLGLLSGSYPAFFMSQFIPVKVLKGGQTSVGGGKIRNGLVIFQFAVSVILMVSTLVVYQQIQFIKNKDLGYNKEQLVIVEDVYASGTKVKLFKEEVKKLTNVKNASLTSFLPTPSNRSDQSYTLEGTSSNDAVQMQKWDIDTDYLATLNIELIEGRNFDQKFSTDSTAMLVNESAISKLGLTPKEAIGKNIFDDSDEELYTIIGVVKNFHIASLRDKIAAVGLRLSRRVDYGLAVKLNAGDFSQSLKQIEQIWNNVAPSQSFNYYFVDDSFNNVYESEQRLGRIFMVFTILSILIACLGLFGLAAFNAQKRTKEIGIRKVLGASVSQITYKLTIDFLKLIGVSILMALPIGWLVMNKWLEDFSYRVEISWWAFTIVALLVITISVLTVGYQSIKAAIENPVKSLKTE